MSDSPIRFRPPNRDLGTLGVGELADFAQLAQFPGWQKLRDHYDALTDKQTKEWGEALLEGQPPSGSEVAFRAGFWKGVKAVLDTPSQAEGRLTRELDKRKDVA